MIAREEGRLGFFFFFFAFCFCRWFLCLFVFIISSWAHVTRQTLISHAFTCQSLWLWPWTHLISLVLPSNNSLPLMSDQPISCSCFMMSYDTCLWLVDFSCLKLFLYLKDDIWNDKDYWKKKHFSSMNQWFTLPSDLCAITDLSMLCLQ